MQFSMFSHEQQSRSVALNDITLFDWEEKLREIALEETQSDFVSSLMPESNIVIYKSGSSAKTDLQGYMEVRANIGICATDASKPVLSLLAAYISQGGKAFIDSGAFRHFKATLKNPDTPPIDFDDVFSRYDSVVSQCTNTDGLIVVAPDIVGQQSASYDLLKFYRDRVLSLYARGATIMVPLQKGKHSLKEHYYRCKQLLGFDFICGLPSNAEAVSRDEVMSFLDIEPSSVHFLGTAESSLVHEAQYRSPATRFSCDATLIRKHIGKNRLLTEMQTQVTEDVVANALKGRGHCRVPEIAHWDETEVLGDLLSFIDVMSGPEQKRFAQHLNTSVKTILSFDDNEPLWCHLDAVNYGYASNRVVDFLYSFCRKSMSPQVRKSVISELSLLNII